MEKLAGRTIKAIIVRENQYNRHSERCFYIVRDDGSEIDFGAYVPFKTPDQKLKYKLNSAMRRAIDPIMMQYKKNYFAGKDVALCEISGKTINWDNSDVHHADVWSFKRIGNTWLKARNTLPNLIDVNGIMPTLELADATDFVAFHNARAILQVVHRQIHQKTRAL
jgi:hypothetical protein